jgi:hexokinase
MIVGIFSHFFGLETSQEERNFFKSLAKLVGRRAARLSACGIAAIVSKKGYVEEGCDVGADGACPIPPLSPRPSVPPDINRRKLICPPFALTRDGLCSGSLYNKYPKFAERIHEALVEIFGEQGNKIKTHHAEDGSGVGSAIIAGSSFLFSLDSLDQLSTLHDRR